ncbi:hypothetical protein Tco_0875798 [Tanacetum coccineum]|uniref:Uncharacterized protein n=1 Tax=Tanacetum coccineum TaxID=301880 RepID=A0ABQ5BT87_9ASTR
MLWDYLALVIANWKGEVVMMGNFNEVRKKEKDLDQNFNVQEELAELDAVIDKGEGNEDVVNKRTNVVNSLKELEKLQALKV